MRRRSGFTLVELMVVVTILLILSTLAFAVFNSGRSSDRMRSAARTAQSAFLGAKDRALHAKDLRGVRLTRDSSNPNLVNGFVFLQPLPIQSVGNINGANWNDFSIIRPGLSAKPPYTDATEILANTGVTLNGLPNQWLPLIAQDNAGVWPSTSIQVRIPSGTGNWYQLQKQSTTAPYWFTTDKSGTKSNGQPCLLLQVGYPSGNPSPAIAIDPTFPNASCDIQLGNDVLPFHQPITMPSGCVIDLAYSNQTVQLLTNYPTAPNQLAINADIMFSPRGNVTGTVTAFGMLMFAVRDMRDCTPGLDPNNPMNPTKDFDPANPTVQGDTLILAITPQTGLVSTYEADLTDVLINTGPNAGTAGADGYADNIFNFAQKGQSAGR